MTLQAHESSTEVTEFIGTFLKGFVGEAFTAELEACFTSEIQGETARLQAALDNLKDVDTAYETKEFMDIINQWPAILGQCTDEANEIVEEFFELAADFEDAGMPEGSDTMTLAQVAPVSCWKDSFGRGAGYFRSYCPPGMENDAGLCYEECEAGYYGVGPVCWQYCPEDHTDIGLFCWKPSAWDSCPNDMANAFWSCVKGSYGRGGGTIPECNPGDDAEGLCYEKCPAGYNGVGPVCW